MSAIPSIDPKTKRDIQELRGDLPSPIHPPVGCVFHPRCPIADGECQKQVPQLFNVGLSHKVACIKVSSK